MKCSADNASIPSKSHYQYSLEGEDRGRDEKLLEMTFGYRDDEVRVSCVWEGRGELVVWLVKFAWAVKKLDYPDQQKCKPKTEWEIMAIAC